MAFYPPCVVGGAIVPGVTDFPAEPTYTVEIQALSTAGAEYAIPDGARYVQLEMSNSTSANIYGSGAPVLSLRGGSTGVPQLIRDYTNGICIPPVPGTIAGSGVPATDPEDQPTVTVDTTVQCDAILTFYLEF